MAFDTAPFLLTLNLKQTLKRMMQKIPHVSIIITLYNRRHLIERAIDSVQKQTYNDYELLIVDDGSTDGVEDIILPKIHQNAKWRYLKHANRKIALSRNVGIQAAFGKYITFLDSDDEYLPEHIQLRVKYLHQHPEVGLVHGGIELVEPEQNHWVKDVRDMTKKIHVRECFLAATMFGKRDIFLSVGGFPAVEYSPEYHFIQKIKAKKYCVKKVDYPTYRYHTEEEDRICRNINDQYSASL